MKYLGLFGGPIAGKPLPLKILNASLRSAPFAFALGAVPGIGLGSLLYEAILKVLPGNIPLAVQGVVFLLGFALTWLAKGILPFLTKKTQEVIKNLAIAVIGAAIGVALVWVASSLLGPPVGDNLNKWKITLAVILALVVGYLGGLLAFVIRIAWVLLHNVPNNFQGIVKGHDPDWDKAGDHSHSHGRRSGSRKPSRLLVDWLSERIDNMAGPELQKEEGGARHPLTFTDLSGADITLTMVSANLNHGIPYKLPFSSDNIFLFKKSELAQFFPAYIVDWMTRHTGDSRNYTLDSAGNSCTLRRNNLPGGVKGDYYFVPQGGDLPVVVAMRMSLSIPVFFSAVPLHGITAQALAKLKNRPDTLLKEEDGDVRMSLFCDGGTTNNFPIHFFDAWLPSHPTFGINLTAMPADAVPEGKGGRIASNFISANFSANVKENLGANALDDTVPDIVLPKPDELQNPEWKPLSNPIEMFRAMVDTAREAHDNLQTMLPGYRERIVQIRLKQDEGGMNLDMTPDTIKAIQKKGKEAAQQFRVRNFNFDHHRWTRFLALMSRLEKELEAMHHAYYKPSLDNEGENYDTLLRSHKVRHASGDEEKTFPYLRSHEWLSGAIYRAETLLEVVDKWKRLQESDEYKDTMLAEARSHVRASSGSALGSSYHPVLHFFDEEADTQVRNSGAADEEYPSPKPDPVMRVSPEL